MNASFFSFLPAQREKSCVTRLYFLPQNKKVNTDETAAPHSTLLSLFLLLFFNSFSYRSIVCVLSNCPAELSNWTTPMPKLFVFSIVGPKQNPGSLLTHVSDTVFYALWHGTLSFALHGSFFHHFLIGENQVPPVTEENRVAFFSSDHRPSDVAGELLFFFKRGNIFVM